ncbi:MAG: hypothetical protein JWM65_1118 [Sphingomonas bacterium]|nr:hypothetical protein [Sphingomonas bacterium]
MATALRNERSTGPEIGRVWSQGFDALGRRLGEILFVSFIFGGLPVALFRVLSAHVAIAFPTSIWMTLAAMLAMFTMTSVFGMTAAYGLISRLVIATLDGRDEPVGRAVDNITRRFPILIAMALLTNLGVGLATLLLFIPGIMLLTAWAISIPVASVEALGPIESLRRSMRLTRGARWQVFGLMLVLGLISGGGTFIINRATTIFYGGTREFEVLLSQGWPLWHIAATAIFQTFGIAISASLHAALYVQLRNWKDGPQSDNLAEVFA